LDAITAAVASVTDPADRQSVVAAVRSISPGLVDDVVFGLDGSPDDDAGTVIARGVGVSPSRGAGVVCTSADDALDLLDSGAEVVLWVDQTGPADEPAMRYAAAIVTASGGPASHAAIVARQWGIAAVCGVGNSTPPDGKAVSVDGAGGTVTLQDRNERAHRGSAPIAELPEPLEVLLSWADALAADTVTVAANADSSPDVLLAQSLGAAGVGLCRTEHQFLGDRVELVRPILEGAPSAVALEALVAAQTTDLQEVLMAAGNLRVKVRLLDAPLHEFLPSHEESNPMLGLRGARLAMVRPGLVEAQATAIAGAVRACRSKGLHPQVSVTIPMVAMLHEFTEVASRVRAAAGAVDPTAIDQVGVMVETPRAALICDELSRVADYLSFGTNDLTQLALGLSRDDVDPESRAVAAAFGPDPFVVLDQGGVGALIAGAITAARQTQSGFHASVCGEQASDPSSIEFLVGVGVNELSVAPYRVPAVRLAAAHAVIARDALRAAN